MLFVLWQVNYKHCTKSFINKLTFINFVPQLIKKMYCMDITWFYRFVCVIVMQAHISLMARLPLDKNKKILKCNVCGSIYHWTKQGHDSQENKTESKNETQIAIIKRNLTYGIYWLRIHQKCVWPGMSWLLLTIFKQWRPVIS